MTEEAKRARREYNRRWYAANRERVRDNQRKYWQRKAEGKVREKTQSTEKAAG